MLQAGLSQERSVLTVTCLPPLSRGGVWLLDKILTCLNLCKDVFPVALGMSLNFLFWHSRLFVIWFNAFLQLISCPSLKDTLCSSHSEQYSRHSECSMFFLTEPDT